MASINHTDVSLRSIWRTIHRRGLPPSGDIAHFAHFLGHVMRFHGNRAICCVFPESLPQDYISGLLTVIFYVAPFPSFAIIRCNGIGNSHKYPPNGAFWAPNFTEIDRFQFCLYGSDRDVTPLNSAYYTPPCFAAFRRYCTLCALFGVT